MDFTTATITNPITLDQLERIRVAWGARKRTEVLDRLVEREHARIAGDSESSLTSPAGNSVDAGDETDKQRTTEAA